MNDLSPERAEKESSQAPHPQADVPLRDPETVMRLARLGSFHQTRLSFMRVLLRRLARENWRFERTRWEMNAKGEGFAVYEARGSGRVYTLVAFSQDLAPEKRTDRVIAEEWDATFTLHDGIATMADIARLAGNVPRQEAGRYSAAEIVLARANKSVRLFEYVVGSLAAGRQPEAAELDNVGYLMRTTAVYGSGKFGLADHLNIAGRAEFSGPFAAEMLTVWLIRAFTVDLAEHIAEQRSPGTAVRIAPDLRRRLGVGNSTGLGMAPFIVHHPGLFDRWIAARETALARVRSLDRADSKATSVFRDCLARGRAQVAAWRVEDQVQKKRIEGLSRDLATLSDWVDGEDLEPPRPWDRLYRRAERKLGLEAQEYLVSLLLEPHGALIDDLADGMAGDESADFVIDGAPRLAALAARIDGAYRYALATDFQTPDANARFWYVSEEKLEPRLGERATESGAEREQPLAVARDVAALRRAVRDYPADMRVSAFLMRRPEFRHVVRRVQLSERRPYAEVRDNLIDASMRPIDILRCKLSFFGAAGFDPRSDRWVRIALYRHAPFPDELSSVPPDEWAFPPTGEAAQASAGPAVTPPRGEPLPLPAHTDAPTRFSLNEIEAQLRKAARGAGLAWGLAEEAGKCGRVVAASHAPALERFADSIEATHAGQLATAIVADGAIWRSADRRPLNPLILGPSLMDHAHALFAGSVRIESPVFASLLLAPFLASIAVRLQRPVFATTDDVRLEIAPDRLAETIKAWWGKTDAGGIDISLGADSQPMPSRQQVASGVGIEAPLWARFDALAALTYVPPSEASRLKGAGAGMSDND